MLKMTQNETEYDTALDFAKEWMRANPNG